MNNEKKEKDITSDLDIFEIIKNVKVEQKIEEVVAKPSISNGDITVNGKNHGTKVIDTKNKNNKITIKTSNDDILINFK